MKAKGERKNVKGGEWGCLIVGVNLFLCAAHLVVDLGSGGQSWGKLVFLNILSSYFYWHFPMKVV